MNYLLIPTALLACLLFEAGMRLGRRAQSSHFWLLSFLGLALAIPGILFAVYYFKILGEPIWLYEFRSAPLTELTAAGAGFLAGLLHAKFSRHEKFRRIAGRQFFPILLGLGMIVPYLKPLVRRAHWQDFQDRWSEDVCLQTSESSCGPACAATLLRQFGKNATEAGIARASFTSQNGTENWYLARTLRAHGCEVQFTLQKDPDAPWPFPSIAGVRLPASGNNGHFIAVLGRTGDKYVIGDSPQRKLSLPNAELRGDYDVIGFFIIVTQKTCKVLPPPGTGPTAAC